MRRIYHRQVNVIDCCHTVMSQERHRTSCSAITDFDQCRAVLHSSFGSLLLTLFSLLAADMYKFNNQYDVDPFSFLPSWSFTRALYKPFDCIKPVVHSAMKPTHRVTVLLNIRETSRRTGKLPVLW